MAKSDMIFPGLSMFQEVRWNRAIMKVDAEANDYARAVKNPYKVAEGLRGMRMGTACFYLITISQDVASRFGNGAEQYWELSLRW